MSDFGSVAVVSQCPPNRPKSDIRHPTSGLSLSYFRRTSFHALQACFNCGQCPVELALLDGLVKNVPALAPEVRGEVLAEGFGQQRKGADAAADAIEEFDPVESPQFRGAEHDVETHPLHQVQPLLRTANGDHSITAMAQPFHQAALDELLRLDHQYGPTPPGLDRLGGGDPDHELRGPHTRQLGFV